ncbi:MAG: imidazole glycerol phosphate synthase subunit HisF [Bacillota bacterium]
MLTRRVIPCLDVDGGRVVKGVHFVSLRDAGDPVQLAAAYSAAGADELVFLDISATVEKRQTSLDWVRRVAEQVFIPLTVGGGIGDLEAIGRALRAGADKIALNSAAVADPDLVQRAAVEYGTQCIVVAVDARRVDSEGLTWEVYTHGGTRATGLCALQWCQRAADLGAGELLVTSVDADGTSSGYDLDLLRELNQRACIPLIASGGAGGPEDMLAAYEAGADAALAASIFHYGRWTVRGVKEYLAERGVVVRL